MEAGRRNVGRRGRRPATGKRNAERRARRQFAQFMICGAAFVTLVAAKLFTPQHALELRRTFAAALDRNMDVQGALSAVGRTFAGENDAGSALRQVWEAAFIPASDGAETSEAAESAETSKSAEAATEIPATAEASDGAETSESAATAKPSEPSEIAETLTQYHWSGSFGNSTAFASLSEPWPDASEASATADGVTKSASGESAASGGNVTLSGGSAASDKSAPSGENAVATPSDGAAVEDKGGGQASGTPYSAQNLPDNVGMEQVLLNFDYRRPVEGEITSGFGCRKHPVDGAERFHYGVDFSAPEGTAVVCFADGVVTAIGDSVSFGKYCTVEHANGFTTLYAHCSKITATAGSAVRMGDKLAEVGSTGQSAGPHLHFALQREGVYLNPVYYVAE